MLLFSKTLKNGIIKPVFKSGTCSEWDYAYVFLYGQYGFSEGKSTEDAIYKITIFLDLSEVIDTPCHKTLVQKLQKYVIWGKT